MGQLDNVWRQQRLCQPSSEFMSHLFCC